MTSTVDRPEAASAQAKGAQGGDGSRIEACEYAYFNGALVPFADANVSIATHALNYGTAIFEGIRAYRQHDGGMAILLGREHYQRFLRNGRLLRAEVPETADDLLELTRQILARHPKAEDVYIRPLLYKSAPSIRLQLTGLDDRVAIYAYPMGDYVPTTGLKVTVSAWQRVNDNAIPARGKVTGSYVNACLAVEDAHTGGFQEAVLLAHDGHVAEASSANVFVVHDGAPRRSPTTCCRGSPAPPSSRWPGMPATRSRSEPSTAPSSSWPMRSSSRAPVPRWRRSLPSTVGSWATDRHRSPPTSSNATSPPCAAWTRGTLRG